MNDWEREANATLRALGDAWQQGGISRESYRERRRRTIATLRARRDVTERRPLGSGDGRNVGDELRPSPRRGIATPFLRLTFWATVLIAAAIMTIVWLVSNLEQGNV